MVLGGTIRILSIFTDYSGWPGVSFKLEVGENALSGFAPDLLCPR